MDRIIFTQGASIDPPIGENEIITSLSSRITFEYIEDEEYIKKKLDKRLKALATVGKEELLHKKENVSNTILNYLNTYYNYDLQK